MSSTVWVGEYFSARMVPTEGANLAIIADQCFAFTSSPPTARLSTTRSRLTR